MHHPELALVVVERGVQRAAVVPDAEGVRGPAVADLELRLGHDPDQVVQDRLGLRLGHVLELGHEARVDVEDLAAGLRMGPHHRVQALVVDHLALLVGHHVHVGDVAGVHPVHGAHAREHPLHAVREGVIGHGGVDEDGVAAEARRGAGIEGVGGRRPFQEGEVRMPAVAEIDGLVGPLAQLVHEGRPFHRVQIGVDQRVPEAADEPLDLGRRELLAREEQGDVLQVGVVNGLGGAVVQLTREVDAEHLGPARAAKGTDLDLAVGHGASPDWLPTQPIAWGNNRVNAGKGYRRWRSI